MAVQLVKDGEKLVYKVDGSSFFYRRISTTTKNAIIKKHTRRGKTDYGAVAIDVLDYVVIGWEDVQIDFKDIPFDPALVRAIPEDYQTELLELSGGNVRQDEDGPKNSKASSPGK